MYSRSLGAYENKREQMTCENSRMSGAPQTNTSGTKDYKHLKTKMADPYNWEFTHTTREDVSQKLECPPDSLAGLIDKRLLSVRSSSI